VIALANWVCQGCAIALIAQLLLLGARRASASARHGLWWLALILVLLLPALQVPGTGLAPVNAPPSRTDDGLPSALAGVVPAIEVPDLAGLAPFAIAGWGLWVIVSLVRLLLAWRGLRAARRDARPFDAARERRLRHWPAVRGRGRLARLVLCPAVRRAGVLGGRVPLVALSPEIVDALDDSELDQIIAHEWVHVQRRDDAAIVMQAIVRAIAGLHPAVWWINRRIDFERELSCDELAVRVTGSLGAYARCLAKIAALPRSSSGLRLAPAASSRASTRIARLLAAGGYPARSRSTLAFAVVAATLLWLAPVAARVEMFGPPAAMSAASSTPSGDSPDHTGEQAHDGGDATPAGPPERTATRGPEPLEPPRVLPAPQGGAARGESTEAPTRAIEADDEAAATGGPLPPPVPPVETPSVAPLLSLPGETAAPGSFGLPGEAIRTPWGAAADSGAAIGKGSQQAAVATARFFTGLGRKIAGSF
jgi:beta-lactamase regulating signal transducer with metallopeptidase domain